MTLQGVSLAWQAQSIRHFWLEEIESRLSGGRALLALPDQASWGLWPMTFIATVRGGMVARAFWARKERLRLGFSGDPNPCHQLTS